MTAAKGGILDLRLVAPFAIAIPGVLWALVHSKHLIKLELIELDLGGLPLGLLWRLLLFYFLRYSLRLNLLALIAATECPRQSGLYLLLISFVELLLPGVISRSGILILGLGFLDSRSSWKDQTFVLELVSLAFDGEPHLGINVGVLHQDIVLPLDSAVNFTLAKEVSALCAVLVFDGVHVWSVALGAH